LSWESFHFLRPGWLILFLPLAWSLWRGRRGGRAGGGAWSKVVDPELLPHLLVPRQGRRGPFPLLVTALAFAAAILALAGPAWEKLPQPLLRSGSALVILFDLSRSMDARDLKPSRLERARYKVEDLLSRRQEGETALVVFAGAAFTVVPLTDDVKTVRAQLPALSTDLPPAQGSNLAAAIRKGMALLRQAGHPRGRMLALTDGVNGDGARALRAAEEARRAGYRLSVIGVGTPEGAPIPTGKGVLEDASGNIVVARLDERRLRAVARAGGGGYARIALDDADLRRLDVLRPESADLATTKEERVVRWRDRGPWLLLGVLPLAALAFRRGLLSLLLAALLLPAAPRAQAGWWQDLWQRPDQQGRALLEQHQPEQAAARFRDFRWRAAALYRAGKYREAAELWRRGGSAEDRYNLGNALARQGRLHEAVAAYDQALALDPGHRDARANKALLEKLLRHQRKQNRNRNQKQHQNRNERSQTSAGRAGKKNPSSGGAQQQAKKGRNGKGGNERRRKRKGDRRSSKNAGGPGSSRREQGREPRKSGADRPLSPRRKEALQRRFAREMDKARKETRASTRKPRKEGRRPPAKAGGGERHAFDERALARDQWLRRIPDDPGGLLRRKFRYYYQRESHDASEQNPW